MTATPLDLLDRSFGAVGVTIDQIRPDQWSDATPCDAWAVREVVAHLVAMNRVFAATLTDSPLPEREPVPDDDLPSAYRSTSDGLLRVFTQPGVLERTYESPLGTATGVERLSIRLYDLLAHGWDLARATGQATDFPDDATEHALAFARTQMDGTGVPGRFAPAQPVAADAPLLDRLAAHLGRQAPLRQGAADFQRGEPPAPASFEDHSHIRGPFLHGTKADLAPGELLLPGRPSHFRPDRPLAHVYFSTRMETAVWGAELAAVLAPADDDAGPATARVYEVAPVGPFEDDPNVTDKKFPGNPTRSYRSRDPLRVIGQVTDWVEHSPQELQGMLANLARLRASGQDIVLD